MRSSTDHRLLLELTLVRSCDGAALSALAAAPPTAATAPRGVAARAREVVSHDEEEHAPAAPVVLPPVRRPIRENILAQKKAEEPIVVPPEVAPDEVEIEAPAPPAEKETVLVGVEMIASQVETNPVEETVPADEEVAADSASNEETETESAEAPAPRKKKGRRIHDFDSLVELWPAVVMRIRKKIGVTAVAYLHDARPVGFSDEEIILEFYKEFHFAKATEASKRLPFEDKINETLDKPRRLRFQMAPPAPPAEAAPAPIEPDDDDDDDLNGAGDIVEYAQNMFGAQIMGRSG